jgi:SAM-dependent methyltransferase
MKDMDNLNIPSTIHVDRSYGRTHFALDDEQDSSSVYSIASSMYNFKMENGRRYLDYKDWHPFPYDEVSEENEVTMHHMMLLLLDNKYYLSPIPESSLGCVADVGTGLGQWAEGVAERYPDTQVIGIDTAPHERSIHPNCSYLLSDATEEWILDDPYMKFDLVYIRSLFGVKDWPELYKQCFKYVSSHFMNKFR